MESGFKSGWNLANNLAKRYIYRGHEHGFVFPWVLILLTLLLFTTLTTLDLYLNDVRLTHMEKQAVIKQNIFQLAQLSLNEKWQSGDGEEGLVYEHPLGTATAICTLELQLLRCQWTIETKRESQSYFLTYMNVDPPP